MPSVIVIIEVNPALHNGNTRETVLYHDSRYHWQVEVPITYTVETIMPRPTGDE
jgi:hypothetical protein